jgi:hypothetical protein
MSQLFDNTTAATRFLGGYIEAALWSSIDDDGNSLDSFGFDDIDSETYSKMVADCAAFQLANNELLGIYYQTVQRGSDESVEEYAGHDFWLSRNRHGAGFFDRDAVPGDVCDKLQDAAEKLGCVDLYVENDEVFAN